MKRHTALVPTFLDSLSTLKLYSIALALLLGSLTQVRLGAQPSAESVTPSSGAGYTQTFKFVYSDTSGWTNLQSAYVIFNSTLNGFNACYVDYSVAANWISLDGDNNNWGNAAYLGSGGTVQNSQCSVNATASSASGSGNDLTLNLVITFFSSFTGAKYTYMQAIDNAGVTSQWLTAGAWTVGDPTTPTPSVLFSAPSSGFGSSQPFSFYYSDTGGWGNLNNLQVLFNSAITGANGCYVGWNPAGWIVLMNDAGTNWVGSLTLGSSGSIQNSQCTISGAGSSTNGFGNGLTLNLAMDVLTVVCGSPEYLYVGRGRGVIDAMA